MNASQLKYMVVTVELHSKGEQLRYESTVAQVQNAASEARAMLARCMDWMVVDTYIEPATPDGDLVPSGRVYSLDVQFAPFNA
jgi:hypothetical protein